MQKHQRKRKSLGEETGKNLLNQIQQETALKCRIFGEMATMLTVQWRRRRRFTLLVLTCTRSFALSFPRLFLGSSTFLHSRTRYESWGENTVAELTNAPSQQSFPCKASSNAQEPATTSRTAGQTAERDDARTDGRTDGQLVFYLNTASRSFQSNDPDSRRVEPARPRLTTHGRARRRTVPFHSYLTQAHNLSNSTTQIPEESNLHGQDRRGAEGKEDGWIPFSFTLHSLSIFSIQRPRFPKSLTCTAEIFSCAPFAKSSAAHWQPTRVMDNKNL